MAIQYAKPLVIAANILNVLDKNLVYAGAPCSNRNYEGEIANVGDSVRVLSIADPTISDYTANTDITAVEALTDAQQTMYIDQAKAFNFQLDDLDSAQAKSAAAMFSEAGRRAGFKLRDTADGYVGGLMASNALPANTLGLIDASSTATNVYDSLIVPAGVALDEQNVPTEGRWGVLPPAVYAKLQLDGRFIKVNESGGMGLRNGVVGDAGGFTLYKSNNAPGGARTGITATTVSGAKTLTAAAAGTFYQSDVGLSVTGTGVGASAKVASVDADGTVATLDTNSTASATVTNIAIVGATHSKAVIFGSPTATSYAEQISKVRPYTPEKRFAQALMGLHLYGAKVFRPEALVVGSVKTA